MNLVRELEQQYVLLKQQSDNLSFALNEIEKEIESWKRNYVSLDQFYKKQIEDYEQKLKLSERTFYQEIRNQKATKTNEKESYINSLQQKISALEQSIYVAGQEKIELKTLNDNLRRQLMEKQPSINTDIQTKITDLQGKTNLVLQENQHLKQLLQDKMVEAERNHNTFLELKSMYSNLENGYRAAIAEKERFAQILSGGNHSNVGWH